MLLRFYVGFNSPATKLRYSGSTLEAISDGWCHSTDCPKSIRSITPLSKD
jgi:hypothetical protein